LKNSFELEGTCPFNSKRVVYTPESGYCEILLQCLSQGKHLDAKSAPADLLHV